MAAKLLLYTTTTIGICYSLFLINKNKNTILKLENEINNLKKEHETILNYQKNRFFKILSMQDNYNKLLLDNKINNINCTKFYYNEYIFCDKLFENNKHTKDYTYYYRPRFINLMLSDNYEELNKLMATGFDIFTKYKANCKEQIQLNTTLCNTNFIDHLDYISLLYDEEVISLIDDTMLEYILKNSSEINHSNIQKIINTKNN